MKKSNIIFTTIFTIVVGTIVFLAGFTIKSGEKPLTVYNVFLDGNKIGTILDKDKLYNLIDQEQESIKKKFNVEKVYPPNSLKVVKHITYDRKVNNINSIYNEIKDTAPFTIKGYKITIKGKDENVENKYIYVLNKKLFEESLNDFAKAIIGKEKYQDFVNNTQVELTEIGSIIESVYFSETITIREALINTEEQVFEDKQELNHFLMFGNIKENKSYIIKAGDTISNIAFNNKLSVGEFLIANPDLKSENALISAGQFVNVDLISPVLTLIADMHVVYDESTPFETEYLYDESKPMTYYKINQAGEKGVMRVTKKTQYVNGTENEGGYISTYSVIKPTINKVVTIGARGAYGNDSWSWPTIMPYYISSYYGWRWYKLHAGIDITGCGFGSPIRSSTNGTVYEINTTCPDNSFYGSSCGGGYGNFVRIKTVDGVYIVMYGHMKSNVVVKTGDTIKQGQLLGYMGNSGSSQGTHLHFEINSSATGVSYNPCKVAFSC